MLDAIGAAICGQNGLATRHAPADMAAAILALEWDAGLKLHALLFDNGRLEFNHLDERRSAIGGTILKSFAVDTAGYTSADSHPWKDIRTEARAVYPHSSLKAAGITNFAYWFNGFSALHLVLRFENLSGVEDVTQLFASCGELRTMSATSFDNSKIKRYASVLYGCSRLMGGADGFVPMPGSGASVLKLGRTACRPTPSTTSAPGSTPRCSPTASSRSGSPRPVPRIAKSWPPTRCVPTSSTTRSSRRHGHRSTRA